MLKKIIVCAMVLIALLSCVAPDDFDTVLINYAETITTTTEAISITPEIIDIIADNTTTPEAVSITPEIIETIEDNITTTEEISIAQEPQECKEWCTGCVHVYVNREPVLGCTQLACKWWCYNRCEALDIDGEKIPRCFIDPLCYQWCNGCEPMEVDGENGEIRPRCHREHKYWFWFWDDFYKSNCESCGDYDGDIVTNWWINEDTSPSWGLGSDNSGGAFKIRDGRIVLNEYDTLWTYRVPIDGTYIDLGANDGIMQYDEYGRPIPRGAMAVELTTTQWDEWGIQIFQYGGDVTLVSKQGILSQMPELQEDNLRIKESYREERTAEADFEIVYIYYHDLPDSKLWRLLMPSLYQD